MSFWYNVDSGEVQTDDTKSQGAQVMGPYETHEEASRALEKARARNEKWDEEDRDWNERGAAPSWGDTDSGPSAGDAAGLGTGSGSATDVLSDTPPGTGDVH